MSASNAAKCIPLHRRYHCMLSYNNRYHNQSYSYCSTVSKPINNNPNTSSLYSSLFPTKREEQLDFYIDPNKETFVFDIDGTIADIESRLSLSPGTKSDGTRTRSEWNVVLNGDNYKYDKVIPVAWGYLKYIESLNKYNIIYLSGRRSTTLKASMKWLFGINKYPKGFVIHRLKGVNGQQFKYQQLLKLNDKLNIAGYFGDRIIDDCACAIKAGVRPILVIPNEWLFAKHIYGGMRTVIEDMIATNNTMIEKCKNDDRLYAMQQLMNKTVPDAFVDIARNSKFWNMPYNDLVPTEFATELFDDRNEALLPQTVLFKLREDEQYWNGIMNESNKIIEMNQKKEDQIVEKFIEDSDSDIREPPKKRRKLNNIDLNNTKEEENDLINE